MWAMSLIPCFIQLAHTQTQLHTHKHNCLHIHMHVSQCAFVEKACHWDGGLWFECFYVCLSVRRQNCRAKCLSLNQRFPNFFCSTPPSTSQWGWRTPNPPFKKNENENETKLYFIGIWRLMFKHAQITRTRRTTSTKFQYNVTKLRTSFHF